MIKSKYATMVILGMCLTISSPGVVYANADEVTLGSGRDQFSAGSEIVSSPIQTKSAENPEILQKQREIDQYVFEKHKDEIAQKGFSVTHTGPQDNYVEIGIEPFNADNAEYIYTIFGKDMVKVVEGQQAYTLGLAPANNEAAPQAQVSAEVALDKSESEAGGTSVLGALAYTLGAVVILGAAAAALKRIVHIVKR